MKRLMVIALIAFVALGVFAAGQGEAGGGADREMTGPLEKYDPPLTVKVWRSDNNRTYPEGQSLTDNIWTRAIEEELGIVFDYVWIAPNNEMDAKINTTLAAGDLPDVLTKLNLEQYYNLARVGRLAPMSELLETYDVGEIRKYLDYGPGVTRKMLTIDDEIYGWGRGPELANVKPFVARGDWLDAVGRDEMPENIDDIIDLLYEFSEEDPDGNGQDDTYGLLASSAFLGGSAPLETFFATHEAYPNIWVEHEGALVYGSIMPETRDALEVLRQLHADGVLSPEWPVFGAWSEAPDEVAQDKVGAAFAQQWWHNWDGPSATVVDNPRMRWDHVIPRTQNGEYIKFPLSAQVQGIVAANADFANPEALVKLFNLQYQKMRNPETASGEFHTIRADEGDIGSHFYWSDFFNRVDIDTNPLLALDVTEALETGDTSILNPEALVYYDGAVKYLEAYEAGNPSLAGGAYGAYYGNYMTFGPEGVNTTLAWTMINEQLYQIDAFQSFPTPAQAAYAGDLRSTRDEFFIQIIVGELGIDEGWEQWLNYWEANGGDVWAEEVNEWYREQ
ncbi:MAG: hypothetical protein ACOC2N_06415 [Spirochaetota bacterium]